jgi:4-hydroxy-2-oxoheptanedioate aldolase
MTRTNALRRRFAAGDVSYGGWCVTPSSFHAEILAAEGYDYVCVDCQHGLVEFDAMWPMLQAMRFSPTTPVVRVPFNSPEWPGRALDAGAEAVIVPMVNTRDDAERAAAACRYSPEGVRSFGPVRAGTLLGDDPATVNREVMCLVMIETAGAVERADEICSTPGVDGVYVGPADLAVSMGLSLADMFEHPAHAEAIGHVLDACRRHGILPGIHTGGGAMARRLAEQGFRMCTLSTDAALLRAAVRAELAQARSGGDGEAGAGIYG